LLSKDVSHGSSGKLLEKLLAGWRTSFRLSFPPPFADHFWKIPSLRDCCPLTRQWNQDVGGHQDDSQLIAIAT
jgi:hypothetical protein